MDDTVVVRFHRSLYQAGAVRTAAARFSGLGAVTVTETEADILVTLGDVPPHLRERAADELANHALHQTIRERNA